MILEALPLCDNIDLDSNENPKMVFLFLKGEKVQCFYSYVSKVFYLSIRLGLGNKNKISEFDDLFLL